MFIKFIPQFQIFSDNFSVVEVSRRKIFAKVVENEGHIDILESTSGAFPGGSSIFGKSASMWSIILLGIGVIIIQEH